MSLKRTLLIGVLGLGVLSLAGFTYSRWGMGAPGGCFPWGGGPQLMRVGTPAEAREAVEAYLAPYPELRVAEVMEFSNHFYAEVEEKETGIGAMELLVWRDGRVTPEPGPNMMWNQKYGHRGMMGGGMMGFQPWGAVSPAQMPIRPEKAREIARQYLVGVMPGAEAGEPEPFYGYYTLHVLRSGKIIGMLSVNGYSGAVWYHSWHGEFLGMEEGHDE